MYREIQIWGAMEILVVSPPMGKFGQALGLPNHKAFASRFDHGFVHLL